jgi:hypothetical protein
MEERRRRFGISDFRLGTPPILAARLPCPCCCTREPAGCRHHTTVFLLRQGFGGQVVAPMPGQHFEGSQDTRCGKPATSHQGWGRWRGGSCHG